MAPLSAHPLANYKENIMGYLSERVSYLRGLVEGINMDKNSNESRIFDEIIELLDDMATSIEGLEETQVDLSDELEETQIDVDNLVDAVYGDDEDYEYEGDDEDEAEEEEYCETLECPNCGAVLPVDVELLEEDELVIKCPDCGEDVTITLVDDEEADEDNEEECDGDCANCPSGNR